MISNKSLGTVAAGLWIASLFLPAVSACETGNGMEYGWESLVLGWINITSGNLVWLANIPLLIGIAHCLRGRSPSFIMSMIMLAFAATGFVPYPIFMGDAFPPMVCHYKMGFWLWELSCVTMAVAAVRSKFYPPVSEPE